MAGFASCGVRACSRRVISGLLPHPAGVLREAGGQEPHGACARAIDLDGEIPQGLR